tara:strand:- start:28 stop:426 length:399 start_codon:yes stop_codon:yes gene_type:complete
MTRKISIADIGSYSEELANKLVRGIVLNVNRDLKKESPVDSGRFRFSWQVGENGPVGGSPDVGNYPGDMKIRRMNYSREKVGKLYSIHSNLPYAEPLARGHSQQAPAGWIDLIAKKNQLKANVAWQNIIRTN